MQFVSNNLYHIYNQGNNRQVIFHDNDDYFIFLRLTRNLFHPVCDIVAYCCMPNHFHFIISTNEYSCEIKQQGNISIDAVTNAIRKLLSSYARLYNKKYQQSGSVFRQKTKFKCLTNNDAAVLAPLNVREYLFTCFHYVHQNPLRAGLVNKLEAWDFSSFKDYARLRNGTLVNKEVAKLYEIYNPANFIKESYTAINDEYVKYLV
jgi:putative transposase